MRLFILFFTGLLLAFPSFAADRYEFDKSHTRILFFVSHLGFSETIGEFTDYDGFFTFDEEKSQESSVEVALKPAGIRTPSSALDEHLQRKDFFNTAEFPDITFKSREIKVTGKNTGDVIGDLTMLGVTKPVTLKVRFNKGDYHPMTGDYVAGFSGEAKVKRSDFGMIYSIPMVGDEVRLLVETEGVNAKRKKESAPKH